MATSNAIVLENQKPGTPESEWMVNGAGSSNIQGFTTDMSTNIGGTVDFKINTDATNYRIDIYRLGYYGGDGARKVATIEHQSTTSDLQPAPLTNPATGLIDAGNWHITDTWSVPSDAVSGVYVADLVRQDGTPGVSQIPFIIRDDSSHSNVLFQTSDETWEAYNAWGGHNLYDGSTVAVSYNRPFITGGGSGIDGGPWTYLFGSEYPAIRWLEQNGYDVSYISDIDTARNGSLLLNHAAFLSVGHDEYWSAQQMANVQAARDAGVNLEFWSGNEAFWKTHLDPSIDGSNTADRTITTYKTTETGHQDPSGQWTGTWMDPNGAAGGGDMPQNALSGTLYMVNTIPMGNIDVPSDFSKFNFWQNTAVANLQPGQTYVTAGKYLGYEFDVNPDNGFQPAGEINLSSTTENVPLLLQNSGASYAPGTATHSMTLYRAPSGALVFGAGTVFWSWALDSDHAAAPDGTGPGVPTDPAIQQAMVNLFADMGIQPASLQPGLVAATASTDHTPPTSSLNDPSIGGVVPTGETITLHGTASDAGGGVVAGIEVSTDNGTTWHPATGTTSWSYNWTVPNETGSYSVLSRAVDDSLNLEAPGKVTTVAAVGFSASEYLSANHDVLAAGIDPLTHYEQHGWLEGRDPSADFSTTLYLLHNQDVQASGEDPLYHYMNFGWEEGRPIYPAIGKVITDDGFDAEYYLLTNPDVAQAGVDPYWHWLNFGWKEGRNPNAYFDTKQYLADNTDVAAAGENPLTHYHLYGWHEGRNPSDNFNTDSYLAINTDVAAANIDPLQHYLAHGAFELRTV